MSWTKTRSQIATTLQRDPDADVDELRQRLKAERLAEYIEHAVATAPALSDGQRTALAAILAPRSGGSSRAAG